MSCSEKKQSLITYIDSLAAAPIALAFSGGVDSSLLLKVCSDAAKNSGQKVHAFTIHTQLHPMKDLDIAKQMAKEAGADHHILYVDELEEAGIRFNPVDRCYLCKKCLFKKLIGKAEEMGALTVLDGTNADDLLVYRPGIRALKELGVRSPLAELGITKEEVRRMAAEYGLSVSNRPSTPCMATRFPYGTELDYEMIRRVEAGETWLRNRGFYNVRLRVHDNIARIEIDPESMPALLKMREEVICEMSKFGFDYITMDLAGFRSGSMDLHIM